MPVVFFLSLPMTGESGIGAEGHAPAERDDTFDYSGHLSFEGGFDRFGFVPQRTYVGGAGSSEPRPLEPQAA
jgi:hypothetical protein